ncbi:MAG: NAD-dependent epimerase/dehydratase family protein [Candidatus Binatia bacterium]
MRVFIAGGTGTLGRPTIRLLRAAGHEVHALARTAERCAPLRELGAEPVVGDLFDLRAMTETLAGMDAVLHLATRIPPLAQMRKLAAWRDNDRLRSQGASVLVSAAIAAKAKIYLQESITFLYQSLGDTQLFETAPLDAPQPLASAREAERETARFTARGGQGIVLRFGAFYGADAPSTRDTVKLARRRMFPIIGSGDHYFSSIHVDDAAAAVVAALAIPGGVYNVVDDEPMPMRDYMAAFTSAFGFKPAWRLPLWLARLVLGTGTDALTRSQRVNNTMFKAVAAWTPTYPSVRQGWPAVAAAFRARN